jgi:hypothetical protein
MYVLRSYLCNYKNILRPSYIIIFTDNIWDVRCSDWNDQESEARGSTEYDNVLFKVYLYSSLLACVLVFN